VPLREAVLVRPREPDPVDARVRDVEALPRAVVRPRAVVDLPRDDVERLRDDEPDARLRDDADLARAVVRPRALVDLPRDELDDRLRADVALPRDELLDERPLAVVALPRDELLRELLDADFRFAAPREATLRVRPLDALPRLAVLFVLELREVLEDPLFALAGGT